MALGREINDFLGAFGATMAIGDRAWATHDRIQRRKEREAKNPDNFPTVKAAAAQYKNEFGAAPPAYTPPAQDYTGGGSYYDGEPAYRRGGLVIDNPAYIAASQRGVADQEENIPHLPGREYEDGQQVFEGLRDGLPAGNWQEPPVPLPPRQRTEIDEAPMELSQDRLPPVGDYPRKPVTPAGKPVQALPTGSAPVRGGSGGGGGGGAAPSGGRKALNDQSRVEAYDPEVDGPTAAIPASKGALPTGDAPKAAPKSGAGYNPAAGGEGSSPSASADYAAALDGGMQFARNTFHLDGGGAALPGTDPKQSGGAQAMMKGVGAATPEQVRAIDQRVNQLPGVPNDPSIWAIRRLEAVYRWYSQNGETDKANKAAFELIQYSAGRASQYGGQALTQLKTGDVPGAVKSTVQGFNEIPNGQRATVEGNQVKISDVRTGQVINTIPVAPQAVFNAALGLSDRSLYWQQLIGRAGMVKGAGGSGRSESQQDLDRARADYYRARTGNVGKGRGGGGGAVSPGAQAIIDKIGQIDASRGVQPAAAPRAPAARPAASGDDGAIDDDDGRAPVDTGVGSEDGGVGDPASAPAGGQAALPVGQAESVLRLKPRPGRVAGAVETPAPAGPNPPSKAPAKFDPEGDGYDYETAKAAGLAPDETGHWPSRDPRTGVLLKGRQHPTFQKGVDEDQKLGYAMSKKDGRYVSAQPDPDEVPDVEVFREGSRYVPAARPGKPNPYDKPKPSDNPYREIEAMVAKLPKGDRAAVVPLVRSRIAAYEKEVRDWDAGRKEHETNERRRVTTEATAGRNDQIAKMKDAYDYRPRPQERKELMETVSGAVDEAVKLVTEKKGKIEETIFGDPKLPAGTLKHLVLDIMTSNPSPDANRATAILEHLTAGSDDGQRTYKVRGKDVLGNVVVQTENYGFIHLRPETFKQIATTAKRRGEDMVKRREEAAKPKPPSKLETMGVRMKEATTVEGDSPADNALRRRRQAPGSPTDNLTP